MTNFYAWDPDKNARLSAERGLSFEQIVAEIEMHGVLDDVETPIPRIRISVCCLSPWTAMRLPYPT